VTATPPADITDPNLNNNTATDMPGTGSTGPQADLALTITRDPTTSQPGMEVTYTLQVTNNGPATINYTISDGHGGSGRHAELVFHGLDELGELQHGQRREIDGRHRQVPLHPTGVVASDPDRPDPRVERACVWRTSIDVAGIDTKTPKRDDHLRSPDFFDAAKFPNVTFKSTKIEKVSDSKLKITGDLTIRGTTKSVTLDTDLSAEVPNPFSKVPTRAVSASGQISRKEFGLSWTGPANAGVIDPLRSLRKRRKPAQNPVLIMAVQPR
jgi:hypothetical protein